MPGRVVVADDHAIMRRCIAELILPPAGLRAVEQVADAESAIAACARHKPALLVLDLEMPGRDALGAVLDVQCVSQGTKVVILSGFASSAVVARAVSLRVSGFMLKSETCEGLSQGFRQALDGRACYSAGVREIAEAAQEDEAPGGSIAKLTPRELEVLRYIGRGMDNEAMARVMHLSKRTVERHVSRLMTSLGIHQRASLVRYALESGVVPVAEPVLLARPAIA